MTSQSSETVRESTRAWLDLTPSERWLSYVALEERERVLLGERERALDALSRLLDAGANPVAGLGGELEAAIRDGDAVLADLRPEER